MARVRVQPDIEIEYDSRGQGPPIVLVMGIGAQLIHWDDAFCDALAARGFRVIRFDNRDIGRSTWLDHLPTPPLHSIVWHLARRARIPAPYNLSDMARDTVGLMDALGIDRAHIVGASMGGMVAQVVAIEHPGRVQSLTSIMSTTGQRQFAMGKPRAMAALLGSAAKTREEAGERTVNLFAVIGSRTHPLDRDRLRAKGKAAWDRGYHPEGFQRQLAAILTSGSRRRSLPGVKAPTLVIHGAEDPLIPPAAGRATAELIPGARLLMVEGMGHDLPLPLWPLIVDNITKHAADSQP